VTLSSATCPATTRPSSPGPTRPTHHYAEALDVLAPYDIEGPWPSWPTSTTGWGRRAAETPKPATGFADDA
jgi:hypothetical protein